MKNVQISEELFSRIYGYFFLGKQDSTNENLIREELQEKMNRLLAREDYSNYLKSTRGTGA